MTRASPKPWELLHFSFISFNERQIRPEGEDIKLFCRAASIHVSWKRSLQPTLALGLSSQRNASRSQLGCDIPRLGHAASTPAFLQRLREEKELLVVPSAATDMWLYE